MVDGAVPQDSKTSFPLIPARSDSAQFAIVFRVFHLQRTTSVSANGLVLAHVWITSGKPDLGPPKGRHFLRYVAMCNHTAWARSGPYQFSYVGLYFHSSLSFVVEHCILKLLVYLWFLVYLLLESLCITVGCLP